MLNFVGRYIIAPAVIVILLLAGVPFVWNHLHWFQPAEKPAAERLSDEQRGCLVTLAADDGHTITQHRWMVHAALNLSVEKHGMSPCEIHHDKLTLRAPSQENTGLPRLTSVADQVERRKDPANYAQAELDVDWVLAHRTDDSDPCMNFVTRYLRPKKWGTVQDEYKMEGELDILTFDEQGAIFYGPKGSAKQCKATLRNPS